MRPVYIVEDYWVYNLLKSHIHHLVEIEHETQEMYCQVLFNVFHREPWLSKNLIRRREKIILKSPRR